MQLFVRDLTVIDFSYLCQKRGIVGESWIVDVTLSGDLNDQSMVLDFGIVKKQIKAIIDDAVDHKLLLPAQCDSLRVTSNSDRQGHEFVDYLSDKASYFLQSPNEAFVSIETDNITTESVEKHLLDVIIKELPSNVKGLEITLRPEAINGFYYNYTHGLKKHDGNCQRIAHGHRSPINLYKNETRSISLEKQWCDRWDDIYIASECDRIAKSHIELSSFAQNNLTPDHQFFSYYAPQGRFDIAVEEKVLEVVDCDSTVELLADYIARQLKQENPEDAIKVVAYEGVGKGAIASV